MDHKSFLRGLPAETRAQLYARQNARGLWQLAGHLGLIGALALPVVMGWPGWWLCLAPLGVALAFLFTLQHECTHQTPFASAWLNEAIGHLCALVLVQPFLWFRYFHLAHHRHTNDPARDPELIGARKPQTARALLWHLATPGYWWAKLSVLLGNAFGRALADYVPLSARGRVRREARLLLLGYAGAIGFTALVSPILIWVWLVPLMLGFPVLRLYLLAEHGLCPPVADMFRNSRTTLTGALVRALAWNMPYHAEHHAAPKVPFHQLPVLHRLARAHLGQVTPGYRAFARLYLAAMDKAGGR